jgi:hypothetical protein
MKTRQTVAAVITLICIALLMALPGCVTYKKCYNKYGHQGDTITKIIYDTVEVPVYIKVPPDSATMALKLDSMDRVKLKPGDTITTYSADSLIQLTQYLDSVNHTLMTKVRYKGKTIKDTIRVPVAVPCECPPVTTFEPPPAKDDRGWLRKEFDKVSLEICGFLLLLVFLLTLLNKRRG